MYVQIMREGSKSEQTSVLGRHEEVSVLPGGCECGDDLTTGRLHEPLPRPAAAQSAVLCNARVLC